MRPGGRLAPEPRRSSFGALGATPAHRQSQIRGVGSQSAACSRLRQCAAQRFLTCTGARSLPTRYYLDAGSGGLAVGVHSTQFAVRDVGLYEPVLELAAQTAAEWTPLDGRRPLVLIAGLAGRTAQATREAQSARRLGYHAGLLSLAALKGESEDALIAHCEAVAAELPLVGF